ncbi:MAG: RNA 2'-phosphotransferase [bacterium]|nr:RNA 2'-phosphotransferase [bacterium]
MKKSLVGTSKFLSLVLRHKPEAIGLTLDDSGWADVRELLERANATGRELSLAEIEEVVATNDKKRFVLSPDGSCIRASQGHSVEVDLGLAPVVPPERLYHGTVERFLDSIRSEGLNPGKRTHVHLSADRETASRVGQRRGRPMVLEIAAAAMHATGSEFFCSDNGVWLTAHVPPEFIRL